MVVFEGEVNGRSGCERQVTLYKMGAPVGSAQVGCRVVGERVSCEGAEGARILDG